MRTLSALLVLAATAGLSQASTAAPRGACGLPDARPLWLDYAEGSVPFRNEVFGRPGVVAATSGVANAEALRAAGAQTVYWWMKLNRVAGTPAKPTDPATIPAATAEIVDKAIAASGCTTPLIVLNELNGAGTTTPWTDTNLQYRANILEVLRRIAERGARPLLLISARPFTEGDALAWWQQAAQVADIVREVYFPAPPVNRAGVLLGSRTMRTRYRQGVTQLLSIGVPAERIGLAIGFQSGPGKGGREGLQPTAAWLRHVKLQTMAAKQVARELRIGSVVSWGWGTFDQAGADADKPKAACVYLWARDPALCEGPLAAGAGFSASRDEGQIAFAAGTRCMLDGRAIRNADVKALTSLTGDAEVALSALFTRLVEAPAYPVDPARVLELERSIIDVRFRGNRAAYATGLRSRRATVSVARSVIADLLRRQDIGRRLQVAAPTAAEIALYYSLYGHLPVRQVRADTAASWLDGRRRGFALVPPAPAQLLTLDRALSTTVVTTRGTVEVMALDDVLPLGAVPLSKARPAVRAALTAQARAQAVESWSVAAQGRALSRIRCAKDVLPTAASVDLASYLPFLALDA